MRLSDEKITHLTHVALRGLLQKGVISLSGEEGQIRRQMRRVIIKELKIAEDIDKAVREKLHSYSKKIPEGSAEWDVLYRKFFREELVRHGRI